jgi:hypothetical protein
MNDFSYGITGWNCRARACRDGAGFEAEGLGYR